MRVMIMLAVLAALGYYAWRVSNEMRRLNHELEQLKRSSNNRKWIDW